MKKNPDLPPGWSMPQDQANSLTENLKKKKSKSPEQELDEALQDIARDIAILEPNPADWEGWVSILLAHLEAEARQRRKLVSFEEMVKSLQSGLPP
jgi:hypothetical protein